MELTVFRDSEIIAEGPVRDTLPAALSYQYKHPQSHLIFLDRQTSKVMDVNFDQPTEEIEKTLALQAGEKPEPSSRGRGRPKLGVQSREVSLLPRHWDWLSRQPGGTSAALRRLIEEARKSPEVQLEEAMASVERFLQTMAADLPHYEEALRHFYSRRYGAMFERMANWPNDIQRHARDLVNEVRLWEVESGSERRREPAY